MTSKSLNLTNSIDLVANSIALREPDGSTVDITNLFATQSQVNGATISGNLNLANYATQTDLSNNLNTLSGSIHTYVDTKFVPQTSLNNNIWICHWFSTG